MANPDSYHKISLHQLYWAAGFLEGEGWFGEGRSPKVGAGQKQREPLDRLHRLFGGRITYRKIGWKNGIHWWVLDAYRSPGVMMTLYSLMSPRRQLQIKKSIDGWKDARNMRQPGTLVCLNGHKIEGDNAARRPSPLEHLVRCRECLNSNRRRWRAALKTRTTN
jgi:hypothetical protein